MSAKPVALTFGAVLRERRTARALTQEQLAEAASIHPKYVGMLERGLRQPALDVLLRLAQALDLPPGELVTETARRLSVD